MLLPPYVLAGPAAFPASKLAALAAQSKLLLWGKCCCCCCWCGDGCCCSSVSLLMCGKCDEVSSNWLLRERR
jgi:hypothetical protein